jgi:RsiW-degrading membrane proteinase PrsW (M82 family)
MDYWPIILGLIPSIAWLIFYLNEDKKPESLKTIAIAFLTGGVTTFIALLFQKIINTAYLQVGIQNHSPLSFLILATLEEVFKFLGVYYVISKRREFDEPVDAMVYMIAAALGFAAVENIAANFNATIPTALETTTLRFFGATLLHTLSSGLVGYYWAKSILANKKKILVLGLMLATLLHATFNYLIIRYEPIVIPTIFLITLAIFILHDFEELQKT